MTTTCNHACIFCSEDDRMTLYKNHPLTLLQIKTILVDRAKKGFNYVNFTGWEPTLFPKFLELLRFSKKLGYKIYVGTNGTMLANEEFAKEFLDSVDVLSLSIHWYDRDSCVEQTGDQKHYERFLDIAKYVSKYKKPHHYFQSNIVLNSKNYKHIQRIATNMIQMWYHVDHLLVSYVAPEGLARKNYQNLSVKYELVLPFIHELNNFVQSKKNLQLRIFGIPLCKLWDEFKSLSNDTYWRERNTIERFTNNKWKITLIDIYSPDNSRERVFVAKCNVCMWREKPCTGVFKKYLDYYEF